MSKILVVGSSNTDMVVKTIRFPMPGETLLGGEFFMFSGGKGANQAVAAARMGSEVTLICKIGDDIFGKRSVEEFKKEGINTQFIEMSSEKASGTALILVNENGENEIVVASGANETLNENNIDAALEAFAVADVVLLQLETPLQTVLYAAKTAFEMGKKVILNPAPAQQLPEELFKYLYLITPNETEAEILTGIKVIERTTAAAAAEKLLSMGVPQVIITLGAEGAYYKNHEMEMFVPSPKVKAIDTTAAGDVFNGVISVQTAEGNDLEASIAFACKVAAISVTRMGAQPSMPYKKEMEELQ